MALKENWEFIPNQSNLGMIVGTRHETRYKEACAE
jgi:hypothetical protein